LKKLFISAIALLSLSVLILSWGTTGHKKISEASALSFNAHMQGFLTWIDFIREHASDADIRKDIDQDEGPKHYIDIDNYSEFISTGRIPQTFDSALLIHGFSFVEGNGILPWATLTAFDSLRNCMQRRNFAKAKIFAADLGHYVADGHMPLHITKNYDGDLTGNSGIHSRYESAMINENNQQITYTGTEATEIKDVTQYIFNYIYNNHKYCDSVIFADNYAKSQSTNYFSQTYKTALWDKSKHFTIRLFKQASNSLANLIYTAWIQAGKPELIYTSLDDPDSLSNIILKQNTPNPFTTSTHICFTLKENSKVIVQVRGLTGNMITTLLNDSLPAGNHSCDWTPDNLPSGMYYLIINTGKFIQLKKMIYTGGM